MNLADSLYKAFLENHEDFFLVISDSGIALDLNYNVESICKITRSETIGSNFFDICSAHKTHLSFNLDNIKRLPQSLEGSIKTNTETMIKIKVINTLNDNRHVYIVIGKDITELLNYKKSYLTNQMYLQSIIENLPQYVYWKDKNFVYQGCNKPVSEYLHLKSPSDIVGKTDSDFGWSKDRVNFLKNLDEIVIQNGEKNTVEDTIPFKGESRTMLTSKTALYNSSGEIIGILGISVDITERKKLEEDLKIAKESAESASHAKTEFIANMSHDIRTPLSGVVGLGGIVEQEIENPKHRAMIHDMVKSSDELLNMLNEILDVVSLDNITVEDIHEEAFDLPHLVQTIIDLEKSSVDLKNIELLKTIDEQVPSMLLGDHKKIHHIILNLVSNGIKFTKQGNVCINIKLLEKSTDTAQLLFEISDTGMGIPEKSLDKVFELFYKITPSYKGLDKGHGLGLHIVKTYIELLSGKVFVESKLNEGSKFSFTLTLKILDKKAIPQNITQASLIERSEEPPIITPVQDIIPTTDPISDIIIPNAPKILIIEDNDVVRMVTQTLVTAAKCHPTVVSDGEAGLELARTEQFDLILSDIGLPGISGIEFAQQLRQYEKEQNKSPIPIVAITGHAKGKMREECLNAGINDVYIKPIKIETLSEICAKFSLFDDKSTMPPNQINAPTSNNSTKVSALGIDLPNTEAELFLTDNLLIFDSESAKKVIGDNSKLLMDMLKLTLSVIAEELPLLKTAHEANDWEKVAKISHKLKGGFLNIGLTRAAITCQYLERYHKEVRPGFYRKGPLIK
ncbi:MAG: hypothetical protein C0432_06230 [Candidatus Puniceispirillum sp.]|nr:hypothetical protein [Candidatus Puniceispirillum sp.]